MRPKEKASHIHPKLQERRLAIAMEKIERADKVLCEQIEGLSLVAQSWLPDDNPLKWSLLSSIEDMMQLAAGLGTLSADRAEARALMATKAKSIEVLLRALAFAETDNATEPERGTKDGGR